MTSLPRSLFLKVLTATLALTITSAKAVAGNPNPRVLPVGSKPYGMSYGDWGGAWWAWALGIPADMNPILDPDGTFGAVDQSGPVWFLAGTFGGAVERTVSVPRGKALFFPLVNSVWWAPDDLEFAAFVAEEFLGLDPATLSDEELIRLGAGFQVTFTELTMTCTVDGEPLQNLEQYRAASAPFVIEDADLLDDFGIPIAEDNFAVSDGYWIMLSPLPAGRHEIHLVVQSDSLLFGEFDLDVRYVVNIE